MVFSMAVCFVALLEGFVRSPYFPEEIRTEEVGNGIRLYLNAPVNMKGDRPSLVVFYFTPNGSTAEETAGRRARDRSEWRYDIQHAAAQVRRLRELRPREGIALAIAEAEGRSWPAWRAKRPDAGKLLGELVAKTLQRFPGRPIRAALCAHSGGGAAIWALLEEGPVPENVERIALLDANYTYSEEAGHGERLRGWLSRRPERRLAVAAYDDRTVTLDGKPVVGPMGGTYRATERMVAGFSGALEFEKRLVRDFDTWIAKGGQVYFFVNRNYANQILHTALAGEMNGLLWALTAGGADADSWGIFGGPRSYDAWIEPLERTIQSFTRRPLDAASGGELAARLAGLAAEEREQALLAEAARGNFPEFLRQFRRVSWEARCADGRERKIEIEVSPDVFAVGSDTSFLRVPLSLPSAAELCSLLDCRLPTKRVADAIAGIAEVRLAPRPLAEAREAWTSFVQHNVIIEEQRRGSPLGPIVAGTKKDLVLTNRLLEHADRVAIYGWHRDDGQPIQPLSVAHSRRYVDYSHGVRLIGKRVWVEGEERLYEEVLRDAVLHPLLSDEGPIEAGAGKR